MLTCAPLKKMHENEVLLNLPSCSHYRQITITLVFAVLLLVALCVCACVCMYIFVCAVVCVCVCVMVYVCRVWTIHIRNLLSVCPSEFPFSVPFFLQAKKGKKESLLNCQKHRFLPSVYQGTKNGIAEDNTQDLMRATGFFG